MLFDYTINKRDLQRGYEFLIKLFNNVDPDNRDALEYIRGTINYVADLKGNK